MTVTMTYPTGYRLWTPMDSSGSVDVVSEHGTVLAQCNNKITTPTPHVTSRHVTCHCHRSHRIYVAIFFSPPLTDRLTVDPTLYHSTLPPAGPP